MTQAWYDRGLRNLTLASHQPAAASVQPGGAPRDGARVAHGVGPHLVVRAVRCAPGEPRGHRVEGAFPLSFAFPHTFSLSFQLWLTLVDWQTFHGRHGRAYLFEDM